MWTGEKPYQNPICRSPKCIAVCVAQPVSVDKIEFIFNFLQQLAALLGRQMNDYGLPCTPATTIPSVTSSSGGGHANDLPIEKFNFLPVLTVAHDGAVEKKVEKT